MDNSAPKKKMTINELVLAWVEDEYCYVPIFMIQQLAKIRPLDKVGIKNLLGMIQSAGYNSQSVLTLRAPLVRKHVRFTSDDKKAQLAGNWVKPWTEKEEEQWANDGFASLYGCVDGAHRLVVLEILRDMPSHPTYDKYFLAPVVILRKNIPEALVIAIASRKKPFPYVGQLGNQEAALCLLSS